MRGSLLSTGVCAAMLAGVFGVQMAAAEDIRGLTVVESGGRTKALIEVPDTVEYSVFALSRPNRLVLDLHNSRFAKGFNLPGPNGVVSNIRTGQPSPGEARVVFDLSDSVHTRSYFQHEGARTQLVVELADSNAPSIASASTSPGVTSNADRSGVRDAPMQASATQSATTQASVTQSTPSKSNTAPTNPMPVPVTQPISDKVTAIETIPAPPSHPSVAELRQLNPKVPPPVSTVVITPSPVAGEPETFTTPENAQHVPIVSMPKRNGARTVHDLFGARQRKLVVAIDAGHGGQDPGAHGLNGSLEKNVTLAVARELARQINAEPGMQAVLTRNSDTFIPLAERYRIARKAKADIFISIHADADPTHTATGSSVFVLSQRGASSQAARWLADQENAADLIGGVSLGDKDSTLASVLLDLSQSATMRASDEVARNVLTSLHDLGRTHKSQVERANFVVLRSPDVPSMLVETAFITNPGEEQNLNDPDYRSRLATAITGGVRDYFSANPLPGTIFARDDTPTPETTTTAVPVQIARADTSASTLDHVVARGESLADIADQYGVSVRMLRSANGISGTHVKPGTHLAIPVSGGAY
jgi:N-acetylmuramoyl-L-alanine amidase